MATEKSRPTTDWQNAVFQDLAKLLTIGEQPEVSWRAKRPTAQAYKTAVALISEIPREDLPRPRIAPNRDGGLQLEWEKGSLAVEISISAGGHLELLRSKNGRDHEDGVVSIAAASQAIPTLAR